MTTRTRGVGTHHDQRRAQIADAVLTVVAERGLSAVSLSEVATTAGVSVGRVQHYFANKQELIAAAFDRGNAASSARIAAAVGGDLDAAPPRRVLTVVVTELIAHDAATRAHLRVRQWFAALALSDEAIAARVRALYADFHAQLAALLVRDRDAGLIDDDRDPMRTAVELAALAEGLAYYVLIDVCPADTARRRIRAAIDQLYR